jgi:hypothetical protein
MRDRGRATNEKRWYRMAPAGWTREPLGTGTRVGFAILPEGIPVRRALTACLLGVGLAMTDGAALGHHSFSMFDMSLPTEIEGTVEELKLANPHSSLLVKAKDKDGRATTWRLEGGSPTVLDRAGWNAKTLKPGDQIKLTIWPVRGAATSGMWDPKWVHFRDGKSIAAGH